MCINEKPPDVNLWIHLALDNLPFWNDTSRFEVIIQSYNNKPVGRWYHWRRAELIQYSNEALFPGHTVVVTVTGSHRQKRVPRVLQHSALCNCVGHLILQQKHTLCSSPDFLHQQMQYKNPLFCIIPWKNLHSTSKGKPWKFMNLKMQMKM